MLDWTVADQLRAQRDQIEQAIFARPADADVHWRAADDWLSTWEERIDVVEDRRPNWLRRQWEKVIAEAAGGNRMPPRNEL